MAAGTAVLALDIMLFSDVIAAAKRTLRRSLAADLDEILAMELEAQLEAFQSPDFSEGVRAFLEKRSPRYGR